MARLLRTAGPRDPSQPSEGAEGSNIRGPNGRFTGCGNPNGRPRKETLKPLEVLLAVLEEEVPGSNSSGKPMRVKEALIRQLCVHASKNPIIALKLLGMAGQASSVMPVGPTDEEGENDDAILAGFLARRERPRSKGGRQANPRSRRGEADD